VSPRISSTTIRLRKSSRASARGLSRGPIPGAVLFIGRRRAVADLWSLRPGVALVRFQCAERADWFTAHGTPVLPAGAWEHAVSDRLYRWFGAVLVDDLD
jgi:hypothetical protein